MQQVMHIVMDQRGPVTSQSYHISGTFPKMLRIVLVEILLPVVLSREAILPMMTYYDFIFMVNIHIILPIHISIIRFFTPGKFHQQMSDFAKLSISSIIKPLPEGAFLFFTISFSCSPCSC